MLSERRFCLPGQRAEARAVRRTGHPDVLLSHADPTELTQLLSSCSARRDRRPAGDSVRTRPATRSPSAPRRRRADYREDHPAERQAARRDRRRRRDPGGQPAAGEAVRLEPLGVRARRHLLAGSLAGGTASVTTGTTPTPGGGTRPRRPAALDAAERRHVAAAVQPEHDLARLQHGRLLPGRADGGRAVSRVATPTPSSSPNRSCAARRARS